ncbi:bifunctional GNAT family N-acetyltransferase/acetate--CoA ligase family protein [Streptomyces cheonanensis]|uniref:Bifunctional GNAT family N-acetyltransferase/acetate--CoA ligase family protein n=1 Tax=Streptomyces cheonanensis TaxID=312720 RepID=A0ABP5GEN3_9ACTN
MARSGDTGTTHALLSDGTTVWLRPPGPGDRDAIARMYAAMSPADLRRRFFAFSRRAGHEAADRMTAPPRPGYHGILAGSAEEVVGAAEYDLVDAAGATAEIGLAVADGWHHRGIGTLMIEHLVDAARREGVSRLTAEALADNQPVLQVFADLGLPVSRRFEGNEVRCTVRLDAGDDRYPGAVDERARAAGIASLVPLLRPGCVAVIGAGTRPASVGRAILRNLTGGHFTGLAYAVNPHARFLEHVPSAPSVAELPRTPDLAVLALPAPQIPGAAEACGRAGVRALVVVTSGLDSAQGRALLTACRTHGMRLVGPNCLGIANNEEGVRLQATFAAHAARPGTAGIAVQSGGIGIALLDGLSRLGIGVSTFVSLGNKYDVSSNDLLQWWEEDGRTDLAVLHLESFGNPQVFSRTARRVSRRMPVLTVDAGRTAAGRRAAASHTAAAATSTPTRQALFAQAGIIATRSIAELLEAAALLHSQPAPQGPAVAVLSNAAGAGVLAADACSEAGLTVPEFSHDLVAALRENLPADAVLTNPVDLTPTITEEALARALATLSGHDSVDAVLVSLVPTAIERSTGEDLLRAVTRAGGGTPPKPVLCVLLDQPDHVTLLPSAAGGTLPSYADPVPAARALAHATAHHHRRTRAAGVIPELTGTDREGSSRVLDTYLAAHPDGGRLDPPRTARLLSGYGIRQLPWAWATDEDTAARAAQQLAGPGGRVALKGYGDGPPHGNGHRAVHLDLAPGGPFRAAYRSLSAQLGERLEGVLVQSMAPRGPEWYAGAVRDPVFGPVVLFGPGGATAGEPGAPAARLAPLTDSDVHDLLTEPRIAPALTAYARSENVDLSALEDTLLRLSAMATDLPQITGIDLDPVMLERRGAVVVGARIQVGPPHPHDPFLRQLP